MISLDGLCQISDGDGVILLVVAPQKESDSRSACFPVSLEQPHLVASPLSPLRTLRFSSPGKDRVQM